VNAKSFVVPSSITGPGPALTFYAGRGTAASPATWQNGDIPGDIDWFAYTGSFGIVAQIANTFTGTATAPSDTMQIQASDARLKNVIGRSDSGKDLATLENIEVTDYTMKDVVKYGTKPFKKVIAQQVEKVYPTAVTTTGVKGLTFTPDVYAVSDSIKMEKPGGYTIRMAKAHDLKDGDTVRLITSKNPELAVMVHVQNDKSFTVETKEPLGEKVFVYGKECLYLKAVDYEAISMLNVSATQELAKKVDALEKLNSDFQGQAKRLTAVEERDRGTISKQAEQIAEQDSKIAALDSANTTLQSEVAQLKAANDRFTALAAQMEALTKAVTTLQQKERADVRTVSSEQ
jgi:hypothetical protein